MTNVEAKYPPPGPESYQIPFDDSFSRKSLEEQRAAIREKIDGLPEVRFHGRS